MKIKLFKVITTILLVCTIIANIFSTTVSVLGEEIYQPSLSVEAKSAILVEPVTGKVLFEHNSDERLPIASVTKVMTILLIYEALADGKIKMDDNVTISEHAASMGGSQIFLEPMEQQSVKDLTKAIIICSANDAAVAMAEYVGGSEESFVSLMNKRAEELGMENTAFKNACGLDIDGHFSSARDVAIMSRDLITKHPEVFDYTGVWQDTITHKTKRGANEFGLTNTNKLIKWYNGATGLKTGSTSEAKFCLSATATRDKLNLISVILGSPTPSLRFQETMKMFDYGFANFKVAEGDAVGTNLGKISVEKGQVETVPVEVKSLVGTVIPKGNSSTLQSDIKIYDKINAPVEKGEKAGEVVYKYNGTEIGKSDLIATDNVAKATYFDMLEKLKVLWFE